MFVELHTLLQQSHGFSHEYWHDCARDEAIERVKSFDAPEWRKIHACLPGQNRYWKATLADVLGGYASNESLKLLAVLLHEPDNRVSSAARQALGELGRRHAEFDADGRLKLRALQQEADTLRHIPRLLAFFHRKTARAA